MIFLLKETNDFFFQNEKQAPTLWSKRKHLTVWFFLTYYNKWTRLNEQDYCERNSNKKIGPNHRKCCNMRATSWNSKSNRSLIYTCFFSIQSIWSQNLWHFSHIPSHMYLSDRTVTAVHNILEHFRLRFQFIEMKFNLNLFPIQ